ncbi:MAG: CHAT domain-containing protein, partial [Chloroflexi bacterium]|nr:CHAT domain-containing protein [Chloroflexota bacterium]
GEHVEQLTRLAEKVKRGTARPADMDELGERMFNALFPAEVTTHLRDLLSRVNREGKVSRLELDMDEAKLPAIAMLPWEFLRAPQTAGRAVDDLGTHPKVVLSRRRGLWDAAEAITLAEPLRIQLVVAAPKDEDLGAVLYEDIETRLKTLAETLPTLIAPPLETLHNPDIMALEDVLEEQQPHVLHVIGHGRLRKIRKVEVGEFALIGSAGYADWRTDEEIGEIFQVHSPAIVFFQACESGAAGSASAFVGLASQVVQRNVPVVIAMQYPVRNVVAITFAEELYRRLGKLEPVDVAVQRGRRRLKQKFRDTRDYAAPVIFMRLEDGQLFHAPQEAAPVPPQIGNTQSSQPAASSTQQSSGGTSHSPGQLNKAIADFLTSVPNMNNAGMYHTLLYSAGLDQALLNQINLSGPPVQFVYTLISTLSAYGTLEDGRNALVAVLQSAQDHVGSDRKAECERLIQEIQTPPTATQSPTRTNTGGIDFQAKRCRDLADNIQNALQLIKEYEDRKRSASDPKTRLRIEAEIRQLQEEL